MASGGETKQEARARIRARRQQRTAAEIDELARDLAQHAAPLLPDGAICVTAYQSMATEPGTVPLIAAVLARRHRLLLPRINGRALTWVPVTLDSEFARGPLGIMEPTGPALADEPSPLLTADLLFLPGLSVDHAGRRLGQGGGYYDSALSAVPRKADGGPLRVAVLFDDEFVEHVPHQAHDRVVDGVLTPNGLTWISPSP